MVQIKSRTRIKGVGIMKIVYEYNKNKVMLDHDVYTDLKKFKQKHNMKSLSECVSYLIDFESTHCKKGGGK